MRRRQFIGLAAATVAAACAPRRRGATGPTGPAPAPALPAFDAASFAAARRTAELPFGTIAYVERGAGDAALFLHGAPLNGFQWRGAIDRLAPHRRCVAPDFMGLGYSDARDGQSVAADAQVLMLAALLDHLGIDAVDLVGSDSGGAAAQLFAVRYPTRVRTMLLTNCDTEPDSPPPKVMPVIELSRAGTLADTLVRWRADKAAARAEFGAAVYHDPSHPTDEMIEYYFAPIVSSARHTAQFHAYHIAFLPNPLAGIEAELRRSQVPTRIVWGASDDIFSPASPEYLDRTLGQSRGIRRVPEGKLFFPEEYPDVIADEAMQLWGVRAATG